MPVGLENLGTHQMPLISGSAWTAASTASMSGPWSVRGTGSSSMPRCSQMPKWRSYPGTGARNLMRPQIGRASCREREGGWVAAVGCKRGEEGDGEVDAEDGGQVELTAPDGI